MTAEPDLLPSSIAAFTEALHGDRGSLNAWLEVHDEREVRAHVEAYARANIGVATAAKDAEIDALRTRLEDTVRDSTNEIEALRAEVAAWRELSDHVRVGACKAIWPDRYTDARIRDVADALKRAAWMAEAVETLRAEVEKVTCELTDTITRADKLAEALRELVEVFSESGMYDDEVFAKARAALGQENKQ